MSMSDRLLTRKRAIIETINDELKNIAQVEHSTEEYRTGGAFQTQIIRQLHRQYAWSLSSVLFLSKETKHRLRKSHRHTTHTILNSSNSR